LWLLRLFSNSRLLRGNIGARWFTLNGLIWLISLLKKCGIVVTIVIVVVIVFIARITVIISGALVVIVVLLALRLDET